VHGNGGVALVAPGAQGAHFQFCLRPAVEVQRFLRDSLLSEQVELTLADFNRETLEHVEKAIQDIKGRCHRQTPSGFRSKPFINCSRKA